MLQERKSGLYVQNNLHSLRTHVFRLEMQNVNILLGNTVGSFPLHNIWGLHLIPQRSLTFAPAKGVLETQSLCPTLTKCYVFITASCLIFYPRAKELCCNEDYTMVVTKEGDVVVWGKCYYGAKLKDPIPIEPSNKRDLSIQDVTTCNLPAGDSFVELVVALTTDSNLLFCAGIQSDCDCQVADDITPLIKSDCDCQVADDVTPIICCNKTNLTTVCSVESVLVSVDQQGNAYHADISLWVSRLLNPSSDGENLPEYLVHVVYSKLKEQSETGNLPTVEFTPLKAFRGNVMAVEASLCKFLFCSNVGDVYSWSPVTAGHIMHHKELNSEIIVQIACGANHFAALSDEGKVFTCGDGSSGQLGNGTFQSAQMFQLVLLTEFDRVKTVCCGWASTSVVTENGKASTFSRDDFAFHSVSLLIVFYQIPE